MKVIYFLHDVSECYDHFEALFLNLLRCYDRKIRFKFLFFLIFFIHALRLLNGWYLMLAQIDLASLMTHRCRCPHFVRLHRKPLCFSFYEASSSQILLCKTFASDRLVFFEACLQVLEELLLDLFNQELKFYQNVSKFLQKAFCRNYLKIMILLHQLLLLMHILLIKFLKVKFNALLELTKPYQVKINALYGFQLELQTWHSMIFFLHQ